jgi:hypothetical protein
MPAKSVHAGKSLALTARLNVRTPCLIAGLNNAIVAMMINPEANEMSAAWSPLSSRCESSPFARAWRAISTPEIAAKKSRLFCFMF